MITDKIIQVVMLGSGGVGKTSITLQYVRGDFSDLYVPTIEDDFSKTVEYEGKSIQLGLIDTAGQDVFKDMYNKYMSYSENFILVCAVDDLNSLDRIKELFEDIKTHRGKKRFNVVAVLNKCDLDESEHIVTLEKAESKIHEYAPGTPVFETSAKTGQNIDEIFMKIIELHFKNDRNSDNSLRKNENSDSSTGGCCKIQ